jgi:GntR family histidine utilization transcriptional repressor
MPSDTRRAPVSWQAIQADVLRRIEAGEWPPGAPIPNEVDLAAEFGCARTTVSRALRELAATGLLERRRKAGTRVALHPPGKATFEIPIIQHEVETRGCVYGYGLIAREMALATLHVRSRMALDPDASLLRLRALHLANGAPYMHEDRWVSPRAVPEILDVDLGRVSANAWLVQNVPFTQGTLTLCAKPAEADLAQALGCAPGAAIFTMERVTWLGRTAITFVVQSYAPGHRVTTTI